jgi:NagD protein
MEFLKKVKTSGKKFMFLTNNSSKSSKDYINKLSKMGINIENSEIFTSGEATCLYLKDAYPANTKYFVMGTDSLVKELESHGLKIDDENPDVVILGYDTTITYEKIRKTALFLRKGLPYIATHPDINCPSPEGFIPDAGSYISLFEVSTGRKPNLIIGKPNRYIIDMAMKKAGVVSNAAIIGDRLYTDIASGINAGIKTILVLTGETTLEDLEHSKIKPNYVLDSIKDLIDKI